MFTDYGGFFTSDHNRMMFFLYGGYKQLNDERLNRIVRGMWVYAIAWMLLLLTSPFILGT
jgi:hypothetical protein